MVILARLPFAKHPPDVQVLTSGARLTAPSADLLAASPSRVLTVQANAKACPRTSAERIGAQASEPLAYAPHLRLQGPMEPSGHTPASMRCHLLLGGLDDPEPLRGSSG